MSESAARVREPIDLEEFERRLRGPAPQPREQKSLDELARLLEGQEAAQRLQAPPSDYANALAASRQQLAASLEAMSPSAMSAAELSQPETGRQSSPQAYESSPRTEPNPFLAMGAPPVRPASRTQPAPIAPAPEPAAEALYEHAPFARTTVPPPRQAPSHVAADAAPVSAPRGPADLDGYPLDAMARPGSGMGLRGSLNESEPLDDLSAMLRQYPDAGDRFATAAPPVDDVPPVDPRAWDGLDDQAEAPSRAGGRRPLMLIGGAVAVCVIGVGTTMWLRSGAGDPRNAPTITAASGPVKVQPETPKARETAGQTASILDRNGSERLAASRVVTREEQPVDIREAARTAARSETPPPRPTPGPNTGAAPSGLPTAGPAANGFFPEPRRVRTVSVRPDGTIINDAQPGRAAAPTPPQRPAASPAPARPVGPGAAANTAPQAVASAAPRPPGSIPGVAPSGAAPAAATAPAKVTARATPAASAPVASIDDDAQPARVRTAALGATTPAAAPRAASGSFEVQMAAPGSEREARAFIATARQKYAGALEGQQPTIRKATVGDREIYRVRVVGMSQESANGLCSKLKASGGSCFVARN